MISKTIADTIERALRSAGLLVSAPLAGPSRGPVAGTVRAVLRPAAALGGAVIERAKTAVPLRRATEAPALPRAPARPAAPGTFDTLRHRGPTGERAYRLYVPAALPAGRVPLVVMLHGCKQDATDFATGTRMNAAADRAGVIVAYPEQTSRANGANCWNWFDPADQRRDAGEPAILAGIVRDIVADHPVDPRRVFVAGLSAGAAMAVILGRTYPDLFAAVGVHSGLPYAAAHDVGSAFAAMHGRIGAGSGAAAPALPSIVFHGDRDRTVAPANADEVVAQALAAGAAGPALQAVVLPDEPIGGRVCSRTLHLDAAGRPQVEQWTVHGAGHAWSGGDPAGSFTDPEGPDASAEMLRFFLAR